LPTKGSSVELEKSPQAVGAATGLLIAPVQSGDAGGPDVTADSPSGAVLLAHLRQQVAQIQAQDLRVRQDAADSVHKMRVATRRLRSALQTFERLVHARVTRPLRDELKWLAAELGAARDAEVMRDRLRTAVEDEDPRPGLRIEDALPELTGAYRTAHARVVADLDGDRYHQLVMTLQELVERPPLRKRALSPAGKVLPALVARSYKRVRRNVDKAYALPAGAERDETMHDVRKAAKQARYAAESVAPVFGKDADRFAAAMEDVQEVLGEHQDSILTRDRLHDLARNTSSTEAAFLLGRLHAREEARTQLSQEHFDVAWKAAGRSGLHRWLR
jgi:CHAD domain-containing protein